VEMGAYHHGFCGGFTSFSSGQRCYMGGSGSLD
jgi:fluoride ion exporter CrcB/FEX